MKKFVPDSFVIAIAVTVLLAYLFPQPCAHDSKIPLDAISNAGIAFIFFFYGLKLSPNKIKSGLQNWKLHILIQCGTFILFPLIVLAAKPFIQSGKETDLWLAIFFLSTLPSTVSTSVVMVSIAKGNIPAAIFNSSISGIIGIVITPLWMGLFIQQQQQDVSYGVIY